MLARFRNNPDVHDSRPQTLSLFLSRRDWCMRLQSDRRYRPVRVNEEERLAEHQESQHCGDEHHDP